MSEPVSNIRNLGPKAILGYADAGITTAQQMRDLGADECYFRYLQSGGFAHFIGYYSLVMGLQGRPGRDCQGKEKVALRKKFEAVKAKATASPSKAKGRSDLEAALNIIGVVKKRA